MLRYIEIAEARGGGLLEPAFVLLLLALTYVLPRRTEGERPIGYALVRLLLITYFPLYLLSLSLDSWGMLGRTLHFACRIAFGVAFIRLSLLLGLEILVPRLQGRPMPRILIDLINGFIYAFATLWLLQGAGLDAVHLLTTGTVLGAIIGLSLQETLGNIFAGLAVQAQAPFSVGQWISLPGPQADDLVGEVLEINWRTTRILTETDQQIDVPNALIARSPIRNFQAPRPCYEEELPFTVPFGVSPFLVQRLALRALEGQGDVDLAARPPRCGIRAFKDDGIHYTLRYHTADRRHRREVRSAVYARLWQLLTERGLGPGHPIHAVRITEGAAAGEAQSMAPDEAEPFYALASLPFLAPLAAQDRRALASHLQLRRLGPGDVVFDPGGAAGEGFIVRSGVLVLTSGQGPSGTRRTLSAGDHVGSLSLMTGCALPFQLKALGDAEIYALHRAPVLAMLRRIPEEVREAIAHRLALDCDHERDALRAWGPAPSAPEGSPPADPGAPTLDGLPEEAGARAQALLSAMMGPC